MIKIKSKIKNNIPIILTILLSCILNIWKLWQEGFANLFYSAGVYSMGQNFHAFFYNSLDPIGFISVDKPPLGLWIQVLFTKVLGFNGMAILLPQAISGVLSVYLIYRIINKRFGKMPGIASALVLAVSPIFVAVSRNNTIDSIMILMIVLASGEAIKATEESSLKHFIFANIFLGLGFNVKMLQAYVIVPAVYLTYFIFCKHKISKRIASCVISMIILFSISLSWIIAVDLTPAENRPYVGSSTTNSELELTLGSNGMGRLIGTNYRDIFNISEYTNKDTNKKGTSKNVDNKDPNRKPDERLTNRNEDNNRAPNKKDMAYNEGGVKKQGKGDDPGDPSIVRLYNINNAGQISWFLLPSLMVCLFGLYKIFRERFNKTDINITMFYFMMCVIPMFIYFSFSNGVAHRYYLATMAPFIAALVGIGVWILLQKSKIIIPIIFGIVGITQLYIQSIYKNWLTWILPVCIIIFATTMILMCIGVRRKIENKIIAYLLAVLLILPCIWSFTPIVYGNNAQKPCVGPELIKQGDSFDQHPDLSKLIAYLEENREGAEYLTTAPSAMDFGAELILQSKQAVMILGGFGGNDNSITLDKMKTLVNEGKVRFAILSKENDDDKHGNGNKSIIEWNKQNGTEVDPQLWSNDSNKNKMTLYKLN